MWNPNAPLLVPEETVIFEQHKVYASPSSEESDKAWDDLLPVSSNQCLQCSLNTLLTLFS